VRKWTVETRDDLTSREVEIAQLACEGLPTSEISAPVFLSSRTVEKHEPHAIVKLSVRSRWELATKLADVVS
jgi:DNA-binding NarL/FixJ family response regulator